MRSALILLLLAGCAVRVAPPTADCPASVPVPAGVPAHATAKQVSDLEIRVEVARERERARGDRCAAAVETLLKAWPR
jgi:hypothetical protein